MGEIDTENLVVILCATNAEVNRELEIEIKCLDRGIEIRNILHPFRREEYFRKIHELTKVQRVVGKNLVRIGSANDGAYIMIDDFNDGMKAYSFGIGRNVSWDEVMAERGMEVYMYDPTIDKLPKENKRFHFYRQGITGRGYDGIYSDIKTILTQHNDLENKNLVLKMDVEGAEWDFILNIDSEILDNFIQITFELHGLLCLGMEVKILSALRKLDKTHAVVWMHANNNGSAEWESNMLVPNLLEITYVNRRQYCLKEDQTIEFPLKIDTPNVMRYEELILGKWNQI